MVHPPVTAWGTTCSSAAMTPLNARVRALTLDRGPRFATRVWTPGPLRRSGEPGLAVEDRAVDGGHGGAGSRAEACAQRCAAQCGGRAAQLLAGVGGHRRQTHAGGAVGDGGWADGLGEHAEL